MTDIRFHNVSVIGGGAWGTTIALLAERAGCSVTLWVREAEVVQSISRVGENTMYLPGVKLPQSIHATNDYSRAVNAEAIFLVAPAQHTRATCKALRQAGLNDTVPVVICSKGIDTESLKLMSEVVASELSNPLAVLSGPTFAREIAEGFPASVVLASDSMHLAHALSDTLAGQAFKVFTSRDVIGAQVTGAVKNVLAIACGILYGMGLKENALSALMTRGLHEIRDLTVAMGGKAETVMEVCGAGDVILTCSSVKSRNMSLGAELGQGKSLQEIIGGRSSVAEGVASAPAVCQLGKLLHVQLPVSETVCDVLEGRITVDEAADRLIACS